MSYYNLISKDQNFILDTKILYINSDDRNTEKYTDANCFEINMPQTYKTVESIRLLNIQFPSNLYNISEELQNNKLILTKNTIKNIITISDGYSTMSSRLLSCVSGISSKLSSIFISIFSAFFHVFK